ncbi:hypothetical protein LOZ65_006821 [Ophidiomyces ophidiicola]|nr:hypothetical protein LOZ65_006821 [Ophidiomyces ophidiicola]
MEPANMLIEGDQLGSEGACKYNEEVEIFKQLCGQIQEFSLADGFKRAGTVVDMLQVQLEAANEKLEASRKETKDNESKNVIAIEQVLEANRRENGKVLEGLRQIEALKSSIQESKKVIVQQSQNLENLNNQLQKLQTSYGDEKAAVTRADGEIKALRKTLKERDDMIEKTKKAGSKFKQSAEEKEKNIRELTKRNTKLEEVAQVTQARLRSLEGLAIEFSNEEEKAVIERFSDLWCYATEQVYSVLKEDFSTITLKNYLAWDKFKMEIHDILKQRLPLPLSNSKAAKHMRLVVMLAILARQIDNFIFQPAYLLEENQQLRFILAQLALYDCRKESFCRSLLLSINPDAQNKSLQTRKENIVRNTALYISELLTPDQNGSLQLALNRIVQRAVDAWIIIQRSQRKFEPDAEPRLWQENAIELFEFPNESPRDDPKMNSTTPSDILFTVFPRISLVDSEGYTPHTGFVQVSRQQQPCIDAEKELMQESSSPPVGRMPFATRIRRQSIATTNVNGSKGTHNLIPPKG